MERTGHRSVEGVRSYKMTSDEQREALSDLLNHGQSTTAAVEQYDPSTGGNTPVHHQHSFNVTEQAVISAISTSELCSLSIPSATFNNCEENFFVGATPVAAFRGTKRRPLIVIDSD